MPPGPRLSSPTISTDINIIAYIDERESHAYKKGKELFNAARGAPSPPESFTSSMHYRCAAVYEKPVRHRCSPPA